MNGIYLKRKLINYCSLILASTTALLTLVFLLWIVLTLMVKGWAGLHAATFFQPTLSTGLNGGLANAIIGSVLLVSIAMLIAMPIGIMAGIFLAEYGYYHRWVVAFRFINEILLSIPTIIIGLFIYQIYVVPTQHFSGWAGCLALALIAIPIIISVTDNMLRLVPDTLRESAAALGAPKWKTAIYVVLMVARTGVITGILLALARISGETAPLLFTALNNNFWSLDMNQPIANLPSVIFQYALSPYDDWHQLAWTGALLITCWVLFINVVVRLFSRQKPPKLY